MSITAGQRALINRIATMAGKPNVVYPNSAEGKNLPRYVVQISGGGQRTMGHSTGTDAMPEIVVRVETTSGGYAIESDALIDLLVARFAVSSRFDGVTIEKAPQVKPALPVTDGVFSVPVVIQGRTFF